MVVCEIAVMCGGFGFFPGGLWWFAVICGNLWWLESQVFTPRIILA